MAKSVYPRFSTRTVQPPMLNFSNVKASGSGKFMQGIPSNFSDTWQGKNSLMSVPQSKPSSNQRYGPTQFQSSGKPGEQQGYSLQQPGKSKVTSRREEGQRKNQEGGNKLPTGWSLVPIDAPPGQPPPPGVWTDPATGQLLLKRDEFGYYAPQENDLLLSSIGETSSQRSLEYVDWYYSIYQPMKAVGFTRESIPQASTDTARQLLAIGGYPTDGGRYPIANLLSGYDYTTGTTFPAGGGGGEEFSSDSLEDLLRQIFSGGFGAEEAPVAPEEPLVESGSSLSPIYFNPYLDYE